MVWSTVWSWWQVLQAPGCSEAPGCSPAAVVGWPGVTYDPAGSTNSQHVLLSAYQALHGFCWATLSGLERLQTADGKLSELLVIEHHTSDCKLPVLLETVPHTAEDNLLELLMTIMRADCTGYQSSPAG